MSLVRLQIKGISYSQTQNGAYALILNEVDGERKLPIVIGYSSIICERDKIEEIIDARTSDAIALALRFDAPIFTYKAILDKAGIFLKFSSKDTDEEGDDSIMVDEILQEGEAVELDPGSAAPYKEMSLEDLRKELEKAVAGEDYEKAAKLRDEISKRKS